MAKTNIGELNRIKVWTKAGGRCQFHGCNEVLWRDDLTMREINRSILAHIIADSPGGPRGDEVLSPLLAKDPSNIMLLCQPHHTQVDAENGANFSVETLREWKRDHEE